MGMSKDEVIKGIVHHKLKEKSMQELNHDECFDCPYRPDGKCMCESIEPLLDDAIALLKEQEHKDKMFRALEDDWKRLKELLKEQDAVEPVLDEKTGRIWLCGKCGTYVGFEDNDPHDPNEFDKYCRECGRPVLWEGR